MYNSYSHKTSYFKRNQKCIFAYKAYLGICDLRPTEQDSRAMLFSNCTAKHAKSSGKNLLKGKTHTTAHSSHTNSKFSFLNTLKGVPMNVPMRYYHHSIKNCRSLQKTCKKSNS